MKALKKKMWNPFDEKWLKISKEEEMIKGLGQENYLFKIL